MVEVRVYSYSNPSGRCDGCVPRNSVSGCCDERERGVIKPTTSKCPQTCDTGIFYCIRLSGQTQECQLNQAVQSRSYKPNTNNLNFTDDILGLPNPIEEYAVEAWRVSIFIGQITLYRCSMQVTTKITLKYMYPCFASWWRVQSAGTKISLVELCKKALSKKLLCCMQSSGINQHT